MPASRQAALRMRAVRAVLGGMTHAEAAQWCGVARGTVTRWMGRYRSEGNAGLPPKVRGRPSEPLLPKEEAATVVSVIGRRCPDQLGLPYALWTQDAVTQLINQWFGLNLSATTVKRYLRGWGLIPPPPCRCPADAGEAVAAWWRQEYPVIRHRAKAAGREIQWGRVTVLRLNPGVDPPVGRRGVSEMVSATTNRGLWRFQLFGPPPTADRFVEFCERLVRTTGKGIDLIMAPHPVRDEPAVIRWLADHRHEIRVHGAPPATR